MSDSTAETPKPARPSIRLTPDEIWEFIAPAHTGIFTTLRRDGMPIATPTWFAAFDQQIYLVTPNAAKKVVRVRNDARSSFLVESGEKWAELKAVHFTGRSEALDDDPELLAKVRSITNEKYAAFRTAPKEMPDSAKAKYGNVSTIIRFTPDERVLSWDNSRLQFKR